jgi:hypothetical protein
MTETRRSDTDPGGRKRGVPPLVWIVIVIVAAWLAYTFIARRGVEVTPQGGTMPAQGGRATTMPATPAGPAGAPGTPGGTATPANTPNGQ